MLTFKELLGLYVHQNNPNRHNKVLELIGKNASINKLKLFPFYNDCIKALDDFNHEYDIKIICEVKETMQVMQNAYISYHLKTSTKSHYVSLFIDLQVTIKFDKIVITNRDDKKHCITDLYVQFDINHLGKVSHLRGTRASITMDELKVGYVHSHLSRNSMLGYFNSFCTGDQSEMVMSKAFIQESIINKTNIYESFLFFFNQIKAFVSYESLEGGPYIKMAEIHAQIKQKLKKIDTFSILTISSNYVSAVLNLLNKNSIIKLLENCIYSINGYNFINEAKVNEILFSSDIIKKLIQYSTLYHNFVLTKYNGREIGITASIATTLSKYTVIKFKKQEIVPKVIAEITDIDETMLTYDIKEQLKTFILHYVKTRIN